MRREEFLKAIKQTVREIESNAEIILYGSRARGDFTEESDWDLLILVNGPLNDQRVDRIRHHLYEIEWQGGEVISSIIRTYQDWESPFYQAMPIHQRIEKEGVRV